LISKAKATERELNRNPPCIYAGEISASSNEARIIPDGLETSSSNTL
jgi:hypothetical protein